jgi:hypothetical protein
MLKKSHLIALVIFLGMAYLCFGSSLQAPAPLPPDVAINPPDPSLPEELKSLLGKWAGQWNSRFGWDAALYIENIDKDSAQVVFAWGEYNTSRTSCHCNPNWVRVRNAKVNYSDKFITLDFYTPMLRPAWLKQSHTVSGYADEIYKAHDISSGRYSYSFIVNRGKPGTMKGHFVSAKGSELRIEMKKIE